MTHPRPDHGRPPSRSRGRVLGIALTLAVLVTPAGTVPVSAASDEHAVPSGQQAVTTNDPGDHPAAPIRLRADPTTPGRRSLTLAGSLTTSPASAVTVEPSESNDGAIPLARTLALTAHRPAVSTHGRIGDGPRTADGKRAVDYDFYRVRAAAGSVLSADIDPGQSLSSAALLLYDSRGDLLLANPAHLSFAVPQTGTYYLAVSGTVQPPTDPFDASSGGAVTAATVEGDYDLDVTLRPAGRTDTDVYAVRLEQGDVLGVTVRGSADRVAITEPNGVVAQTSVQDIGAIYPKASPLPRGGNATADHVADRPGLYRISISGEAGGYTAEVVAQPAPSTGAAAPQTIYLDFSGPTIDNRVFGASVQVPGIRTVSPLRSFLTRWGLPTSAERAVIAATTHRVREALRDDVPGSRVRVVTSLDSPDLAGRPGVSRVIIGGTSAGTGLYPAFGWAESVDPGNFAREESAIVMPELMSLPAGSPVSLNTFLTDRSDRVTAVGQALGNTAAHEAGHLLGNHHTDDLDNPISMMNTGNLFHVFAVGRDRVAGTRDDVRITFDSGRYDPTQGLTGVEDTATRTRYALAANRCAGPR